MEILEKLEREIIGEWNKKVFRDYENGKEFFNKTLELEVKFKSLELRDFILNFEIKISERLKNNKVRIYISGNILTDERYISKFLQNREYVGKISEADNFISKSFKSVAQEVLEHIEILEIA